MYVIERGRACPGFGFEQKLKFDNAAKTEKNVASHCVTVTVGSVQ